MDLFMVLQLLCGLALFLFGMNSMGDGLESLSGGKLEKTLEKMTNSTMKGFILGAAVTAVIQSSSATTVMVVGFVNSGIMKLRQAIGIIMVPMSAQQSLLGFSAFRVLRATAWLCSF